MRCSRIHLLYFITLSTLLGLSGACSNDADDNPDNRYKGSIKPCDVELSLGNNATNTLTRATASDWEPRTLENSEFWKPGPHPTWNTNPGQDCPQNPTIPAVGEEKNVQLYITYPAQSEPTKTGNGDVATGTWPIIVFAHANHDGQCDIFRRYFSLHDHWASWGYVVVAVDGTATNCNRGTRENVELRRDGQLLALDVLQQLNNDPESRFHERLDLDNVVMAGHSRGGGASLLSAQQSQYNVRAVIDLQGIDLTAFGFGSAPILPDTPVLGITAGKDVDLDYPHVEPTEDQLAGPYTWVDIIGAIHAYTADTVPVEPDDKPEISRAIQHDITEFFTTAFLAAYVGVSTSPDSTHIQLAPAATSIVTSRQGATIVHDNLSKLGAYTRWNTRQGTLIDDFSRATKPLTSPENALGGLNVCENFARCQDAYTYKPDEESPRPHYQKASSRLLVTLPNQSGIFTTHLGDAQNPLQRSTSQTQLLARVKGPDTGAPAQFDVILNTDEGTFRVPGNQHIGPIPLSNRFTQLVIPFTAFENIPEILKLHSISFELQSGALFVDDLRLTP